MTKSSFFANVKTLEELKKLYFKLAKQYHPDRGGDLETMQQINAEYDEKIKYFERHGSKAEQATAAREAKAPERFKKIIDILLKKGIAVEIVGSWLWVERPGVHLALLKKYGFEYSVKNKKYYLSSPDTSNGKRGSRYSFQDIREIYGSTKLNADEQPQRALA